MNTERLISYKVYNKYYALKTNKQTISLYHLGIALPRASREHLMSIRLV